MDGNRNADEKASFWKKNSKTVPGRYIEFGLRN